MAGISMAARMPIMAMTVSNSTSVNAPPVVLDGVVCISPDQPTEASLRRFSNRYFLNSPHHTVLPWKTSWTGTVARHVAPQLCNCETARSEEHTSELQSLRH